MLKYSFTATFLDGNVIEQDPDNDVSKVDPKRSAFYDVLEHEKKSPLVSFVLKGEGHEYGVDLRDGHFEIDGVQFFMHEGHLHSMPSGKKVMMPLTAFELVFFRNHTHSFEVSQKGNQEVSHQIVYRMGWKSKARCGHDEQQIMQFN